MSQNAMMDVLYLKGLAPDLGCVLGIFTRTAEPAQMETDASNFVGDGLALGGLISSNGPDLVIPSDMIGILRIPRDWRQIFQATTVYASGLSGTPALVPTQIAITKPTAPVGPADILKVTLPPSGTIPACTVLVLVQDEAGGLPISYRPSLAAGQSTFTLAMAGLTANAKYTAFIFVPSFPMVSVGFTA